MLASVSLIPDMELLMARARTARSRILPVAEDSDSLNCYRTTGAAGVLHRGVSASNFPEAVRQIRMGADFVLATDGPRRLELCACLPERTSPRACVTCSHGFGKNGKIWSSSSTC